MRNREDFTSFSTVLVTVSTPLLSDQSLLLPLWSSSSFLLQSDLLNYALFLLLGSLLGAGISKWLRIRPGQHQREQSHLHRFYQTTTRASDCREIELALRQSETRLRAAQRVAQVGFWELDLTTQQLICSTELRQVMGLAALQQPTYSDFFQCIHPEDRSIVQTAIDQAVQTKSSYRIDFRVLHPDGTTHNVEGRGEAVFDAEGKAIQLRGTALDITQRKQTEAALRLSEEQRRLALDFSYIGSWDWQITADKMSWNEHNFRILGFEPGEIQPTFKAWKSRVHPNDMAGMEQALQTALREHKPYKCEYRIVHPDGSWHWVVDRGKAIYNALGQPVRMLGVIVDITERKRIEFELQQQAERERSLRVITQHIRQSLNLDEILTTTVNEVQHTLKADQVLIYRFPAPCKAQLLQAACLPTYPVDQSLFQSPIGFPEACYAYYETGTPHIIPGKIQHECEVWIAQYMQKLGVRTKIVAPIIQHRENITEIWGLLIAQACSQHRVWQPQEAEFLQQIANQLAIAIQQSKLYQQLQELNTGLEQKVQQRTVQLERGLAFEALLKRITDKVRDSLDESQILQTAVRELAIGLGSRSCDTGLYDLEQGISKIAYEYLAEGTPTMLGKVIAMSDFPGIYEQLLQGSCLQICTLPWGSYCMRDPADRLTALACPVIDNGKVIGDLWIYKRDYIFEEAEIRLVKQVANQCSIALRQSRLYQAAQTQVIELERLNQLKDDFLSTVSHELRTPISNVKMAAQLLEIQLKDSNILADQTTPAGRYFQILREECQHEIRLIDDLLDLTRLDANQNPLLLTEIQLQTFIPHIAEPFVEQANSQQQQMLFNLDADLPFITTDVLYLERILSELLNNACKYTPPGGVITVVAQSLAKLSELPKLPELPDETYLTVQVTNTGIEIPETEYDRIFDKFYRIPNSDPWKHGGTGLGLALVKKIATQLGAIIQVKSITNQTTFILHLPLVCPTDSSDEPEGCSR